MAPTSITHSALLSAYEKCGQWQRAVMFLTQLRAAEEESKTAAVTAAAGEAAGVAGATFATGSDSGSERGSFAAGGGGNKKGGAAKVIVKEIHYNIAMSACGKCGEWARAEILFNEMLKYGIAPSSVTYSTLIAAYGHAGEDERAHKRFKEMLAVSSPQRLLPDDYTFVGLMLAPAGRGDIPTCVDIKRQMTALGVDPTVHVYNELMRAADVSVRYELAVEFYQQMVAEGVEPNATTQELLQSVGKKGVEFYEDQQLAASFGSLVAGLVGVAGMVVGRW
jgi:pentatricopeptide repeat protein